MKRHLTGDVPQPIAQNRYGTVVTSRNESSQSQDLDQAQEDWRRPPEGFEFVSSPTTTRPKTVHRPMRASSGGTRAPRSSLDIKGNSRSPTTSSPFSDSTARSIPVTPPRDDDESFAWQDYDIPEELRVVNDGTPRELWSIIQQSFDKHRVMRTSKAQGQAIVVRTTIETRGSIRRKGEKVMAECTANISARSTPSLEHPDNLSSSSLSGDSPATTPESEFGEETVQLVKRRSFLSPGLKGSTQQLTSQCSQPNLRSLSNRTSSLHLAPLSTRMAAIEMKLQESKDRTRQSQSLFKSVPTNRTKAPPSPSFFYPKDAEMFQCFKCFDSFPRKRLVDGLPCRHTYCTACFSQVVCTAIVSESSFPPRCCLQEVPRKTLRSNLSPQAFAIYCEKALEYTVPVANRYYCILPECGRWIDTRIARRANGSLVCPHCRTALCVICHGPRHRSNERCPQTSSSGAISRDVERTRWRHCHRCQAPVNRSAQNRHVICDYCRAESWYVRFEKKKSHNLAVLPHPVSDFCMMLHPRDR